MAQFEAVVESAPGGGHFVAVPDQAAVAIGAKHLLRVKGSLAGAPYRSNLAKAGGRLILGVHKATLQAAAKDTGDKVAATVEADNEPR